MANGKYEELYDEIQSITNKVIMYCGLAEMENSKVDEHSLELMGKMKDLSTELSNTAHELEEHLAWD